MNRKLSTAVFAVATTGALVLAGCSSSSSDTASSTTSSVAASPTGIPASRAHNDADVSFAADMVPHHAQAVVMADMAAAQATNAQVKSIAADIKAAQNPEITKMNRWLVGWGQPAPTTSSSSDMGGMDMGGTGTGMMSTADMTTLSKATGAAFDRMWVQMMITHHNGAIAMAKTELSAGTNLDAKALAQSITTSQTAQIAQLNDILAQLPAA